MPKEYDKTDVRAVIQQYLKENLHIKVQKGGFTNPNRRTIRLYVEDELVHEADFDVVQQREYEG